LLVAFDGVVFASSAMSALAVDFFRSASAQGVEVNKRLALATALVPTPNGLARSDQIFVLRGLSVRRWGDREYSYPELFEKKPNHDKRAAGIPSRHHLSG
jgi:hypothetical protein